MDVSSLKNISNDYVIEVTEKNFDFLLGEKNMRPAENTGGRL